jgi:hypothetical protein
VPHLKPRKLQKRATTKASTPPTEIRLEHHRRATTPDPATPHVFCDDRRFTTLSPPARTTAPDPDEPKPEPDVDEPDDDEPAGEEVEPDGDDDEPPDGRATRRRAIVRRRGSRRAAPLRVIGPRRRRAQRHRRTHTQRHRQPTDAADKSPSAHDNLPDQAINSMLLTAMGW